jgi:DNA-binding CsgD family transcriptional regulator
MGNTLVNRDVTGGAVVQGEAGYLGPIGLLERDGELARIDGLLRAAREGAGGVLLVAGPAGIGKTVLLGTAGRRARRAGMMVLAARGGELEGGFSFGVARQLFEPLLATAGPAQRDSLLAGAAGRALIALDGEPDGTAAAAGDSPFAVLHGLYWLTVNASGSAPLLVAIDDLQWADAASAGFVLYLASRLQGLPVALLVSWRPGEGPGMAEHLARLEQIAAGDLLCPAPLSQAAAGDLLAGVFGQPADQQFAAACQAVTGGNPFLLRELAASLRADGVGPEAEAANRVAGLGPRPVAQAVTLRVARLGAAAGEVARATAILGDGTQLRHAAALAEVPLAGAAAAADGLAEIGVFEPGTPLRFVHPIVRTAVLDDIPEIERGLRHSDAARVLAAAGADLDEVCAHLLACQPAGSREVAAQLRAAARRALTRGAPDSAAAYLRRALAEIADVSERAALLHELAQAEALTRNPAAAQHLREALDLAIDPVRRATIAHDLADLLNMAGQWDAAAELARTAIAELAALDRRVLGRDSPTAVRLQTWWAGATAYDPRLVAEFDQCLDQLLALARGDETESRLLAAVLTGILANRSELGQARALLDHALDEGRLLIQVDSDALVVSQALFGMVWLGDHPRAEAIAVQLLALSRSRGSVVGLVIGACLRAAVRARRGDLLGAETDVRAVAEIAREHGIPFGILEALQFGAEAVIERPGLADVAGLGAAIELGPDIMRTAPGALLREVRGRLALAGGDFGTAQAELRGAGDIYQSLRMSNPCSVSWRLPLARAMAGADRPEALRLADSELGIARRLGFARPAGMALCTRGVLAGGEQGLSDLRAAVGVLADTDARLEHARALVELGGALRRANQRAAAREPLRNGLDLAFRCGATRLAQRASDELHAAGARPRRPVLTGLEALTTSERRVAELAADGMSNPEIAQALFVSLNTVEGHLRHTYQKLSINSRGQLPAALRAAAP